MPPASFKFDDTFAFVRPVQDGRTQVAYPFISNGDRGTRTYSRTLLQREANYVPAVLGFERDSVWEGGDPAAYLISETSPEPTGVGDLMRFTRTYARLPAQQTVYSSRLIDRPVMHDITAGGYYAVSFDNGITSHIFSSRNTVSQCLTVATTSLASIGSPGLPNYLMYMRSNTGQEAYFWVSSGAATIKAYLDATLTACGTFTVSNPYANQLAITWTIAAMNYINYPSVFTVITNTTTAHTIALTGSASYPEYLMVTLGSAHGAAVGNQFVMWAGDRVAGFGPVAGILSTTALLLRASDFSVGDTTLTHASIAPAAAFRYVNGPVSCSVKEVTDFYLPGVSTGITTPADIALVASKLDPISWLTAIQASTSYLVVEGSQLSRWLDGPIYQQTTISVQMSDALESVAVGA